MDLYGKDNPEARKKTGRILVGTQVLEQSLERVLKVAYKIQGVVKYSYLYMSKKDAQPRKNVTRRV